MKISKAQFKDFKRFSDLSIEGLPEQAKLVVLVGPNGSGKSSLFEGFNYWYQKNVNRWFDIDYHVKVGTTNPVNDWGSLSRGVEVQFHGQAGDPRTSAAVAKKLFYFRTAYRNEADFKINNLQRLGDPLDDPSRPQMMIQSEARVAQNYQSIVSRSVNELYDPAKGSQTAQQITNRLIGKVRDSIARVFPGLSLSGPGRPLEGGTFLFEKGTSRDFHYKNLSGGEKAAFDLLLDFVVKAETFDDTVFCIDEPELHMHTKLQAALLDELYSQLGTKSQLWIATHSIGMIRRAMELHAASPQEVVFLDFSDQDFDQTVVLRPIEVDRQFWKKTFEVALDDIAKLVAPSEVIFCEGRLENTAGARNPSFDATIYRRIFGKAHTDTEFVPLGGTNEVAGSALLVSGVLRTLFSSVRMWSVFDRDDRTTTEVADLNAKAIRVLGRRDLESYLWDDEVITKLCTEAGNPGAAAQLIAERSSLLAAGVAQGKPANDIKAASGQLYVKTTQLLTLTGHGNSAVAFARDTLAPLLTPDMAIYRELHTDVFGS